MSGAKTPIKSLNGLRAIAFIAVFGIHTGMNVLSEWTMSVFLILSGFLMFYSYEGRAPKVSLASCIKFSLGKIKRLYPLHIITMAAVLFFPIREYIEGHNVSVIYKTIKEVILNVTLLQSWSAMEATFFSLNGVAWFLSACLFTYFMFPVLLSKISTYKTIGRAIRAIIITLICMVVAAMLFSFIPWPEGFSENPMKWFTYICPAFRLGDFFVGCNLGYIFVHRKYSQKVVLATIIELVSIALVVGVHYLRKNGILFFGSNIISYSTVYLPVNALLVYVFACGSGLLGRLATIPPLKFISDISPYAFLIHTAVLKFYFDSCRFFPTLSSHVWFNLSVSFTIVVLLSWGYKVLHDKMSRKNK